MYKLITSQRDYEELPKGFAREIDERQEECTVIEESSGISCKEFN